MTWPVVNYDPLGLECADNARRVLRRKHQDPGMLIPIRWQLDSEPGIASTCHEVVDKLLLACSNRRDADLQEQVEPRSSGVHRGHGGRAELEPPRVVGESEVLRVETELLLMREPAGDRRPQLR